MYFSAWWNELAGIEQAFWGISIVFSILFIIQFVVSLFGFDFDTDTDIDVSTDMDTDGGIDTDFTVFSVRSIIAFFTFFGWMGVLMLGNGSSTVMTLVTAFLSGLAAMFLVGFMMYQFTKLDQSGTATVSEAMFARGKVYLTIPALNGGTGLITIPIRNSMRQVEAVTLHGQPLPSGISIQVVDILANDVLVVEPLDELPSPD